MKGERGGLTSRNVPNLLNWLEVCLRTERRQLLPPDVQPPLLPILLRATQHEFYGMDGWFE